MDRRLVKFIALVECGSFSVAAKRLKITQPAITLAIASLEHSIGHRLIYRKQRSIHLTPEGQIVYDAAVRIQSELSHMETLLSADPQPQQTLRGGMIDSIAQLFIGQSSGNDFFQNTELMVDNSERIIRDLKLHRLDFGVVIGRSSDYIHNFRVLELEPENFVFMQSPDKSLPSPPTTIKDWLAFNQSSTTYRLFKSMFENKNMIVKPSFFSTSMELIKQLAVTSRGTALLPIHFAQAELANKTLVPLSTGVFARPVCLLSGNTTSEPYMQSLGAHISSLLLANNTLPPADNNA